MSDRREFYRAELERLLELAALDDQPSIAILERAFGNLQAWDMIRVKAARMKEHDRSMSEALAELDKENQWMRDAIAEAAAEERELFRRDRPEDPPPGV